MIFVVRKCDKIIKQKYYKKYLLFTKNKKNSVIGFNDVFQSYCAKIDLNLCYMWKVNKNQ